MSSQEASKKVAQAEARQAATVKVQPDYPPVARQLRLEGNVELEALVTDTGNVERVDIIRGNPIFTKPSADALKKWKFKPFTDGGKPVPVLAEISFSFKL
jgi:protein TonB